MNDEILYKLRPPLRKEFTQTFAEQVAESTRSKNTIGSFLGVISKPRVWLSIVLGLIIVVACARELFSTDFKVAIVFAGTTIYETNYRLEPSAGIEKIQESLRQPPSYSPPYQNAHPRLTQEEALALLAFEPSFPRAIPAGYFDEQSYMLYDAMGDCLRMSYGHVDDGYKSIRMLACSPPDQHPLSSIKVAPGMWEAINLGGVDVMLIRGNWLDYAAAPTPTPGEEFVRLYWDDLRGFRLIWEQENIWYLLETFENDISESDFISMGESMIN